MTKKIDHLEILDVVWYDNFGFIKTKDTTTGEIKIFVGAGAGLEEDDDINYIVSWGHKYSTEQFKNLLERFSN